MRRRALGSLLAVALLAALYLVAFHLDKAPAEQPAGAPATLTLADPQCDAFTALDIEGRGYRLALRRGGDGQWQLGGGAPPGWAPAAANLAGLVWGLCPVTVRPLAAAGDLAQYGLAPPALRLTAMAAPGSPPLQLAVGGRSAISGGWYLQKAGDANVYLWDSSLPDDLPAGDAPAGAAG